MTDRPGLRCTYPDFRPEFRSPEQDATHAACEAGDFRKCEAIECACGNNVDAQGFFPCNPEGEEVPLDEELGFLLRCDRCKRIIDPRTGDVLAPKGTLP